VHWHAAVLAVLLGLRGWWYWRMAQSDKGRSSRH
jgi:hypothetical protein